MHDILRVQSTPVSGRADAERVAQKASRPKDAAKPQGENLASGTAHDDTFDDTFLEQVWEEHPTISRKPQKNILGDGSLHVQEVWDEHPIKCPRKPQRKTMGIHNIGDDTFLEKVWAEEQPTPKDSGKADAQKPRAKETKKNPKRTPAANKDENSLHLTDSLLERVWLNTEKQNEQRTDARRKKTCQREPIPTEIELVKGDAPSRGHAREPPQNHQQRSKFDDQRKKHPPRTLQCRPGDILLVDKDNQTVMSGITTEQNFEEEKTEPKSHRLCSSRSPPNHGGRPPRKHDKYQRKAHKRTPSGTSSPNSKVTFKAEPDVLTRMDDGKKEREKKAHRRSSSDGAVIGSSVYDSKKDMEPCKKTRRPRDTSPLRPCKKVSSFQVKDNKYMVQKHRRKVPKKPPRNEARFYC